MKKILLIIILLIVVLAVWLYFAQPEALDRFRQPATPPEHSQPATPANERRPAPPDSATLPAPSSKRSVATLLLPEGERAIFVNGAPAEPGSQVMVPTGENVITTYSGGRYSQELVMAQSGQTYELQIREKTPAAPKTWDTFQGNGRRTCFVEAPDRDRLQLKWRVDLNDRVEASPIVLGNTAYFSSASHLISALDLDTGKVLWARGDLGSDVSPIVTDQFIFAGDDRGRFAGYRLEDGKMRGFTSLGSYPTSLALISADAFLVVTRENRVFSIKTQKNFRGKLPLRINWEKPLPELGSANATPLILGKTAVFQTEEGTPLSIALDDGRRLWPKGDTTSASSAENMEGDINFSFADEDSFLTPTPASDGRHIFAVAHKTLSAFDAADGTVLWQRKLAYTPTSSLSLAYGTLYIGAADGSVYAHGTEKGTRIFYRSVGNKPIFASPVIFKDKLLVAGGEGGLYLLNCFSGEILTSSDALSGAPIAGTPAVAGDLILAVNRDGKMACFQ